MTERSEPCDERRGALAARALDRLHADDAAVLDAHLESCAACRDELARLRAIAALLPLADPLVVADAGAPPELELRVIERIGSEQRGERVRRRVLTGIAAAAAVIALVVGIAVARDDGSPSPATKSASFADAPHEIAGSATVKPAGDGTVVALRAVGLEPDVTYALWLSPRHGERVWAGKFTPDADGSVDVTFACELAYDNAWRVWASTRDGKIPLDAWFD